MELVEALWGDLLEGQPQKFIQVAVKNSMAIGWRIFGRLSKTNIDDNNIKNDRQKEENEAAVKDVNDTVHGQFQIQVRAFNYVTNLLFPFLLPLLAVKI